MSGDSIHEGRRALTEPDDPEMRDVGEAASTGRRGEVVVRIRYGAHLPHWTRPGATYAVTFRLADSLPAPVLREWMRERDQLMTRATEGGRRLSPMELERLRARCAARMDARLDEGHGSCHLRSAHIASLVRDTLLHFDGDRYALAAWCVMPNHVHVVVTPLGTYELPRVLHSWKSFTATRANRLLGRSGAFWQTEYYDRIIRDEAELARAISYVAANPSAAGLTDWPYVAPSKL